MTRGDSISGGDSSAVQDELQNVQKIEATGSAFAAIPVMARLLHGAIQIVAATTLRFKVSCHVSNVLSLTYSNSTQEKVKRSVNHRLSVFMHSCGSTKSPAALPAGLAIT